MQPSTSKYRNVFGEASAHKYDDVKMSNNMTDGSMLDVNTHFLAFSWVTTAGGSFTIADATNFHRLPVDQKIVSGHSAPIIDLKFSPFRTNLLATASDDSTVRIWEIAEGGVANGVTEQQKYSEHQKKTTFLSFSPCVEELIATSSNDSTVHIWNIMNGTTYNNFKIGEHVFSLDWNHNSSLVGVTSKNRKVQIVDPRSNQITLTGNSHEGAKSQKVKFVDDNLLFTVGFSKSNDRAFKLFDMRNFSEAVQNVNIDTYSGTMTPYFDPDLGLIYLAGKGESTVKLYEFSNSSIKFAAEYRSNVEQRSICFFPKRAMNFKKLEIARCAKAYNENIEYVSFYYPRRNEGYDQSLYPDCFAGEPSLGVEEWLKGENREVIKKNITSLENHWSASSQTFEKKVSEVVPERTPEQIKIAELEASLKESQSKIEALVLENTNLNNKIASLIEENHNLRANNP